MQTKNSHSLRKIAFATLVFISVCLAFFAFIHGNNVKATEISIKSLEDATFQSTQRINEILERSENEIKLTAALYEEWLETPDVTPEDLQKLTETSPFDYIEFISPSGTDLHSDGMSADVSDRFCFIDGMKGNSGVDVVLDSYAYNENLVVLYTPMYYDDEIIGVLVGFYTETQVQGILYSTFFDEDSRTVLCMRDGTIIASCNEDYQDDNVFEDKIFTSLLSEDEKNELKQAFLDGKDYQFQYQGTAGKGNAYVTPLNGNEWILLQTFPSQVTAGFIKSSNTAGVILLIELIAIFVVCIIALQITGYIQKKHLVAENIEQSYVINGITQLFGMFVHVDLVSNTYKYIAGTKPRSKGFPTEGKYDDFAEGVIKAVAEEDDREHLKKLLTPRSLRENMDKDTIHLRYEYRCNLGNNKWDSLNFICIKRQDGFPSELLVTCQDVTRAKEREQRSFEALKEAYQAVESANKAKSTFLSNMSHDIRTPMNAIVGMTAIATMNIDNPERVKDCLGKITVSSQHLLGLINEVLDMSKIESGKLVFNEEEFNLSDTVERVVAIFLPQTEAKKQNFKVNVSDVMHEEIIGDSMRLQQVFVNILGNAVKFTPEGGNITFGIKEKISGIRGCGCYEFTFEDTGIGMDKDFMNVLFEPFVRADNSRTGKVEGTGLGMPIVKNIVQMMNGDIKVESELNKGTKFTVTVYIKFNHSKHDDVHGLENLSVLVADDDKFACESACAILNEIGMISDWVSDGDSAIAKLLESKEANKDYAAVILDWKMPGKDGLETTKEIRARVGENVPIIILSAFDYSSVEQEAREAGVNAFISKPLFRSRLIYVMKSLMLDENEEYTELDELQSRNYSGKRILVAEDNEINMEIAAELLTQVGIEVETAVNGKIAVEKVLEKPVGYYDLIFMDIKMPEMNGYEAASAIRASEREDLQKIPIIAMSADVFMDDVKRAHDSGMNGHVAKPIEIENLISTLDKWIK